MNRSLLIASAASLLALSSARSARADDFNLVLAGQVGAADRARTGTIPDAGYDGGLAPFFGLSSYLLTPFADETFFSHGLALGGSYMPTSVFSELIGDLTYVVRVECPCMRSGNRRWYLSGSLGLSALSADASADSENERAIADQYDYFGLGWKLGIAMDMDVGNFLIGVGIDLREHYGIDTSVDRTFSMTANLRVGFDTTPDSDPYDYNVADAHMYGGDNVSLE